MKQGRATSYAAKSCLCSGRIPAQRQGHASCGWERPANGRRDKIAQLQIFVALPHFPFLVDRLWSSLTPVLDVVNRRKERNKLALLFRFFFCGQLLILSTNE